MNKQERKVLIQRLENIKNQEAIAWITLGKAEDEEGVTSENAKVWRARWSKLNSEIIFLEAFLNNN